MKKDHKGKSLAFYRFCMKIPLTGNPAVEVVKLCGAYKWNLILGICDDNKLEHTDTGFSNPLFTGKKVLKSFLKFRELFHVGILSFY